MDCACGKGFFEFHMIPVLLVMRKIRLIILPPRLPAFRAPEEPHLALVSRAKLPQPPVCGVVAALLAYSPRRGHSHASLLKYSNLMLFSLCLGDKTFFNLFFKSAFPTFKNVLGGHHHAFTFRTEFH